ncbi:MAG: CDP-alcohol phosphatidyltransferase family protein [Candidatus Dormibacteraeota bacterium]|nr:CDP-alcohol phosphatidyltransferase family protein [Candidatus Dormibacteraeota bacterium]
MSADSPLDDDLAQGVDLGPVRGVRGPARMLANLAARSRSRWVGSSELRRSFGLWALLGLALALGSGLSAGELGGQAPLGAALGISWWVLTTAFLLVALDLNRQFPDRAPLSRLGLPNGLTAIRAYMAVPILLYASMPPQGEARPLFLCVASPIALLDVLDGWVARRIGPVTILGRALDPIMDATFFSLSAIGCLVLGFVPLWLVLLVLARYGIPAIAFLSLYPWLPRRPEMVATRFGKVNTFASGVALAGSSLLVLAGAPTLAFDLVLGVILAATAVGQILTLARRGIAELRTR